MLERKGHWVGISHWWLAEWEDGVIVAYGPFSEDEVFAYTAEKENSGQKVAFAYSEHEMPLFELIIIVGWPGSDIT